MEISARMLGQIRNYTLTRLALWLSKRGNRRRAWGWVMTHVLLSVNHLGLISIDGIVVPLPDLMPPRQTPNLSLRDVECVVIGSGFVWCVSGGSVASLTSGGCVLGNG